jgi:hypothetical protein
MGDTVNEKIALALGFKRVQGDQWHYPKEWRCAQYGIPVHEVPDFVRVLEHMRDTINTFGIFPKEYKEG